MTRLQVSIKDSQISEAGEYYGLFSSEEVCRYMDIVPFATISEAEQFLAFSNSQREARKAFRFTLRSNSQFLGTVCVYSIYWHQARASIGYAIQEKFQRRGIMRSALDQIQTILRTVHQINRLQATVLPENLASKRLLETSGFVNEGTLRQYEKWEGKGYVDLLIYSKIIGNGG